MAGEGTPSRCSWSICCELPHEQCCRTSRSPLRALLRAIERASRRALRTDPRTKNPPIIAGRKTELGAVIDRILARKAEHRVHSLALVVNDKGQPLSFAALDFCPIASARREHRDPPRSLSMAAIDACALHCVSLSLIAMTSKAGEESWLN